MVRQPPEGFPIVLAPSLTLNFQMRSLRATRSFKRSPTLVLGYKKNQRWLHPDQQRQCSCITTRPISSSSKQTTSSPSRPLADHRDLAVQQELFTTSPYSPGSPLYLPNGVHVFNKLVGFLRAQYSMFGFQEVNTPTIYKKSLWEKSGHWENYKDDMFEVRGRGASGQTTNAEIGEDEEFGLKPMNCPGHCLLFKSKARSYRDLPIRYADFSALHRNEVSGSLSGLTRVRRFHQDDGHIFCRPGQIADEISRTLAFVKLVYNMFKLGPYKLVLSTRPKDQYMGSVEEWDRAELQLQQALEGSMQEWTTNEGDGAFYGPKIDVILKDAAGKEHQTATIQLDFQLPQRFELQYQAPAPEQERNGINTDDFELLQDSGPVTPVIIHRAAFGSLERFMALLIEHYKGHWPFWLSPRQVIILPVRNTAEITAYAKQLGEHCSGVPSWKGDNDPHIRPSPQGPTFNVVIDSSERSLSKKVFEARRGGYNIIMIVGQKNLEDGTVDLDISGLSEQASAREILESPNYMMEKADPKAFQLTWQNTLPFLSSLESKAYE
ncbi:MAG: hypothetical protein M1812_003493 [Candelaria pacifica]|nr:MAG: hypothetical protein M1812_003493 [Candelaria pacifica]